MFVGDKFAITSEIEIGLEGTDKNNFILKS
jgi:hypothetical protein